MQIKSFKNQRLFPVVFPVTELIEIVYFLKKLSSTSPRFYHRSKSIFSGAQMTNSLMSCVDNTLLNVFPTDQNEVLIPKEIITFSLMRNKRLCWEKHDEEITRFANCTVAFGWIIM